MALCVNDNLTAENPYIHLCFPSDWTPENMKTKGTLEAVCTPTLKSILGLGNTKIVKRKSSV